MKKIIIWLLIVVTSSVGVLSAVCGIEESFHNMPLKIGLMFVAVILIFKPAISHWERYFKNLFDYYDNKK